MTALAAVATYLPAGRATIEELAGPLGLTGMQVKVFKRFHGVAEVRRDPDGTLLDLLLGAVDRLDALRGHEDRVRYVLYARSFAVVAPYPVNPLHELCRLRGLGHATAFAVTHQGCAVGLQAIDIAGRLLAADGDPDALALVLAGEKAFTAEAQMAPESSVFGEGAAACLVRSGGERDRMLGYAAWLRGEFDDEVDDDAGRFQQEYPDSLAAAIRAAVDRAGLRLDDIRAILPHSVNVVAWQRVCRRLGFPVSRVVLDNVAATGHIYCADPFFNYRTAVERGLLRPGEHYLMAAAGAARGATFSAMVFQH